MSKERNNGQIHKKENRGYDLNNWQGRIQAQKTPSKTK